MSDFVRKPLETRLNKKNYITRIEKMERRSGAAPSDTVGSLQDISPALFEGGAIDPSGHTLQAGPYPLTDALKWVTDDSGAEVARALGYYLADGTFAGIELDAKGRDTTAKGLMVLASFAWADDIDVDPARAAIHLRSDSRAIVYIDGVAKLEINSTGASVSGFINLGQTSVTIASGVITATSSYMLVDTEGGAATDNLDTINGGTDGDLLIVRAANNTHDVVLKDATGNLQLNGDFTLDNVADTITLLRGSANWNEISRSNNAA